MLPIAALSRFLLTRVSRKVVAIAIIDFARILKYLAKVGKNQQKTGRERGLTDGLKYPAKISRVGSG
jgi:hypothetical protein